MTYLPALLLTSLAAAAASEAPLDVDEILSRCHLERPEECRGCVEEPVSIAGKQRLHVSRGDGGSGAVASWKWEHLLVDPASCRTVKLILEGGGGFGLDATVRSPAASPATAAEKKALLAYEREVAYEPAEPRDQLRAAQGRPLPALAAPTGPCAAPQPTLSAARRPSWVAGSPALQRTSWALLPAEKRVPAETDAVERYGVFNGAGLKPGTSATYGDRTLTLHTRGERLRSAALCLSRGKDHAWTPLFEAGVVADGPAATIRGAGGGFVLFVERPWRELERTYLLELASGEVRRVIFSSGDRFTATGVDEKGIAVAVRGGDEAACRKAGVPEKATVSWDEMRAALKKAPAGPDTTAAGSGSFRAAKQQDVLK